MALDAVIGPTWSPPGLDLVGGRYPLRVEAHIGRLVDALVSGVITTNFQARQHSVHVLGWDEAARRGLDQREANRLVRRIEVVFAGVSLRHRCPVVLRGPHGGQVVESALEHDGCLDVQRLQEPGRYADPQMGFGSPYYGSEVLLGALKAGRPPSPGPRADLTAVRSAVGPLIELAAHETLDFDTLDSAGDLCNCGAAAGAPDGPWLRRLLLDPNYTGPNQRLHEARRATTRLLAGAILRQPTHSPLGAFRDQVCFGDFLDTDPMAQGIPEGPVWRGVLLRNYSIGAWRRLWAWMINGLDGPAAASEVADGLASALPQITVADLIDSLPALRSDGLLLSAEETVRATSWQPDPETEIRMLALGVKRLDHLDGRALTAFAGRPDEDDLGPHWFARHLDASRHLPLPEFGRDLALRLLARSRRVAYSKMRLNSDGTLWMPSRVRERDGIFIRMQSEGWSEVAVRIDTYAYVLASAGVLLTDGQTWSITDAGEAFVP